MLHSQTHFKVVPLHQINGALNLQQYLLKVPSIKYEKIFLAQTDTWILIRNTAVRAKDKKTASVSYSDIENVIYEKPTIKTNRVSATSHSFSSLLLLYLWWWAPSGTPYNPNNRWEWYIITRCVPITVLQAMLTQTTVMILREYQLKRCISTTLAISSSVADCLL